MSQMQTQTMLEIEKIRPAEDQPRKTFYQESLEELSASIKERGVLQPIVVRPLPGDKAGLYEIVMGERRFRASQMAGLTHMPVVIRDLNDEEAAADALLENFQREDMNAIEKARAVQRLLQFMTYEKASKTLGVSETTVRRMLELLELPPHVQSELIARPGAPVTNFNEGHARALIGLNDDPSTQMRLVLKVKKDKLSVTGLEQLINAIQKYPTKKEVFLHVSASVADQMIRSLTAKEERKRPYRAQTAREHLKAIDKQMTAIGDLMDDRIVEFLANEEMNQLLATVAQATRQMEVFTHKVREALENKDYGFSEVYIHCPLCGRIELIGSLRCSVCWTILRRCYDCGHYDKQFERCTKLDKQVFLAEAENPKEYSPSYKCSFYKPKFTPQSMKLKMTEK
ncbi:MAG: ParB/RepB/Spo0J family partition protein [Fibrella sp.]|nr:ParB/RepB/Spo0J family partition protein [Armatimonadota bacterium]